MICMKCGQENPDDAMSTFCQYCNTKLPPRGLYNILAMPSVEESRLNAVKQKCDEVLDGSLEMQDFADFIYSNYDKINLVTAEICELVDGEDYMSVSSDEVNAGYEGLQLWSDGLSEIYAYSEDNDESHISSGLAMISKGNELVNLAMKINRDSRNEEGVIGTL